jgi:hypothetical protein
MRRFLLALALVTVIGGCGRQQLSMSPRNASQEGSDHAAKSGGAETADWAVDEANCSYSGLTGGLYATGVVTNTTSRRQDYVITVEFRRADGVRIDSTAVTVNEVVGGDTVEWVAQAGYGGRAGLTCPVTQVIATPDGDANTPTTSTNYGQD